jgi:hypothetical protein
MNKSPESNDPVNANDQPSDAADLTDEELSAVVGGLGLTLTGSSFTKKGGSTLVNATFGV